MVTTNSTSSDGTLGLIDELPSRHRRASGKSLLRLTHLTLENWRNFTHADVALARRVFLVGPNASGKSNLLDAIRFLRDVASVGGGLQAAIQRRGGVSRLRSLSARQNPGVRVSVSIGTDDDPDVWQYQLTFVQDSRQPPLLRREAVIHNGELLFERPDVEDSGDPDRLSQTYLEQVNVNRQFRELASFLESTRYLHLVPQLVREPDRSVGRNEDPYGGDFLEQVAGTQAQTRDARLRRIARALRIAVPQLSELKLDRDNRGTPHIIGKYEHWRPQGAWQNETQFSDGTLRLMGLLWSLLDGEGPLLLEEPELSLHEDVVRQIPAMLARLQRRSARQVIVSTHSSALLRDPGVGIDEVLILRPGPSGTVVTPAAAFAQIEQLLAGGVSMAEAVIPYTRPKDTEQLPLFVV